MKYIYIITILFFSASVVNVSAQTAPDLGASRSFALLANSVINANGSNAINGNVGVSPGTNIGNPGALKITGTTYLGLSSSATPALFAALYAYDYILNETTTSDLSGKTLGQTNGATILTPGVYNFTQDAQIKGTLTLNDGGNPNAVFIFKIDGNLNVSASAKVVMSSGSNGANVFWQVGQGATIGGYAAFCGNLLAASNINVDAGATSTGRYFSLGASISLNGSTANASTPVVVDTDGDGIADVLDDYPNDPTRAFNNYSSTGSGSTVAFEDLWPKKGDFDMNDIVVQYKYNVITNAQNIVVHVTGTFSLLASGTSFGQGFGIQFPISGTIVKNLTGGTLEAGQSQAVIILFNNVRNLTTVWNTIPGLAKVAPINYTIDFDVIGGPNLSTFGMDYNPFIYINVNQSRHEVHLPGKPPTSLVDKTLFGTEDDATNTTTGQYYVTKTGLPFAITIPTTFSYPIEKTDITQAYLHFADWAISGGKSYIDWYSNLNVLYRNLSLIYK
jgi:LruC domain-containing protein